MLSYIYQFFLAFDKFMRGLGKRLNLKSLVTQHVNKGHLLRGVDPIEDRQRLIVFASFGLVQRVELALVSQLFELVAKLELIQLSTVLRLLSKPQAIKLKKNYCCSWKCQHLFLIAE